MDLRTALVASLVAAGCYLGIDEGEDLDRDGDQDDLGEPELHPNGSQPDIEAGDPCSFCTVPDDPPPAPPDEPADGDGPGDPPTDPDDPTAGVPEDEYLAGDFDGDGDDDLAVRRGSCVLIDLDGAGNTHEREICFGNGNAEDGHLVGDWDGDGDDELVVRRNHCLHVDVAGDGAVEEAVYCYGNGVAEDQYLLADWDGDGRDTIAVRRGHCLMIDLDGDAAHHEREICYGNGTAEDGYLVGDLDGNGTDDVVVRRDHCLLADLAGDGGSEEYTMCFGNGDGESQYLLGDWAAAARDRAAVRRGHCIDMDLDGDGVHHERSVCFGNGTAMIEDDGGALVAEGAPKLATPAMRFDVATIQGKTTASGKCPTKGDPAQYEDRGYNRCFSAAYFDLLNAGAPHFIAVGTDKRAGAIADAGNTMAYYFDDFTSFQPGGPVAPTPMCAGTKLTPAQAACRIHERAAGQFVDVPRWIVINEIAKTAWRNDPTYRKWVGDTIAALKNDLGHKIVLASPFRIPDEGTDDASRPWKRLQQYAFIAVEAYISGPRGVAMGYSVAKMRARYQESVDRYAARGVPLDRLVLVEHFGMTRDEDYGRAGVDPNAWRKVIESRSAAARGIGFAGFVSYAFGKNRGEATDTNRRSFIEAYRGQALP